MEHSAEYRRERAAEQAEIRKRRAAAGLCNRCGKCPPRPGSPSCLECHDKGHAGYLRARAEGRHLVYARRAAGVCTGCGGPVSAGLYQGRPAATCESCRERKRAQMLARRVRGPRYQAMERDGFRCHLCGSTRELIVHHRNGQGDTSGAADDRLENLITLCARCHSPLTYLRRAAVDQALLLALLSD